MIDRLYDINRVLGAARQLAEGASSPRPVPISAIVRLCRDTVVGGMLPDHERTVEFSARLGLLRIDDEAVTLLDAGHDFLALNPDGYVELTEAQKSLLARTRYLDGCFAAEARRALQSFSRDDEAGRLVWSELDDAPLDADPWLMAHLCQLQVLRRSPDGYETCSGWMQAIRTLLDGPTGLTEERLRQMLVEKQQVGEIGEELALLFEKERLRSIGRIVESQCVRRISSLRVDAGYDIESFDGASTVDVFDRFIEVKSARGVDVRFFWSENEMRTAERLGDRYWIYFIGGIDQATRRSSASPVLFKDPLKSIICDPSFSKLSQGLLVHRKAR